MIKERVDGTVATAGVGDVGEPIRLALSPRQAECLRLVWQQQASSKEIAAQLGISKPTVDGYIAEAVKALGARDRRDAARLAFGDGPRAGSGGDAPRVPAPDAPMAAAAPSTEGGSAKRPWRTHRQPLNELTLAQTLGWIAAIAIGSLMALTLATVIGNGLPLVAAPTLRAFDRLTR